MKLAVNGRCLQLAQGDITRIDAEAIVNAANSGLRGGGGVDGAIHREGGPAIMEECKKIGHCPTGSAVVTGGGRLSARFVIHAVAPIWRGGRSGEPESLRAAYQRSLELATELGIQSLAFPSLGTGAYGYPIDLAAPIALDTALRHVQEETPLRTVTFVLFSRDDLRAYEQALEGLTT